ncbi:hypothetical protein F5Y00DRAFT_273785 [Daldinia vernicosa]|uniref:uncharacterized protein n=1 Tax=Daldinia vernicosa TaxID=114800 RepID=UPI00200870C2|nr:uncharacterized protein F5Y00DRAFT_273785 [Daldinia vernicosa]KAI0852349.1 hypothetical protein F5Y00DRAFT_273785 [Daldinia vernicosa]
MLKYEASEEDGDRTISIDERSETSYSDTPDNEQPPSTPLAPGVPTLRSERAQAQECKALVDEFVAVLRSRLPTLPPPIHHHMPHAVYNLRCKRPEFMIMLFMQARFRDAASPDPLDDELWDSVKVVAAEGVSDEMQDLPCRRFAVRFVRLRWARQDIRDAVSDEEYWTS